MDISATETIDKDIVNSKNTSEIVDESTIITLDHSKMDNSQFVVLKDDADLLRHLELMHDRCITRNLQAAGLGGLDAQQEKLIYGNLDPNARMINGDSILIAVILNVKDVEKQVRYVTILLNEGSDPNTVDMDGKTALMHSCLHGNEKTTKALLHHPSTDITKKDTQGNTGLMYAAISGRDKLIKMYIKAFRKLEKKLHQKSVKYLNDDSSESNFEHLFNENILDEKNDHGLTAYDLASQNDHYDCVQILESEKSRRVKVLQKKLISLNHRNRRSSNSVQTAKESLKKYQRGFGSFDAIFDSLDDKSDDELVQEKSTNFSSKAVASSRSMLNLQAHYTHLQLNLNEARSPSIVPTAESNNNYNGPVLEKLSFWEEFFPRANKIQVRTASNYEEVKSSNSSQNKTIKKSYTESSLSSHFDSAYRPDGAVHHQKKSITQRLVNMLRRKGKPIHHSPPVTDGGSARSTGEAPLRKGHSQPELLRKISRDSSSSVSFQQRIVSTVQRQRQSVDMGVTGTGKHNPYQNYVSLQNPTASQIESNFPQKFDKLNIGDEVNTDKTHSPLKSRSSLPAISKKSLPAKLMPNFNESLLDRDVFNHSSQRKSFSGTEG